MRQGKAPMDFRIFRIFGSEKSVKLFFRIYLTHMTVAKSSRFEEKALLYLFKRLDDCRNEMLARLQSFFCMQAIAPRDRKLVGGDVARTDFNPKRHSFFYPRPQLFS